MLNILIIILIIGIVSTILILFEFDNLHNENLNDNYSNYINKVDYQDETKNTDYKTTSQITAQLDSLKSFCRNMMWLHIPKTSSSLCLVLDNICCHSHFQKVLFNVSIERLTSLVKEKKHSHQNIAYDSAWGCYSLMIATTQYKNNTLKKVWTTTHGYQTNESSMCIKYNEMTHDPDNNIYYHRTKPGQPKKYIHEDSDHEPIFHEYGNHHNSLKFKMITVIRHPKNRFISSCLDGIHREGMTEKDYRNMTATLNAIDNDRHHHRDKLLNRFQYLTTLSDFYGCQVKMLNGVPCVSKLLVSNGFNQTALDFAIERLNQYMFVGIFERYEDTVNMLHFYANVSTSPHPIELIKLRKTDTVIANFINERLKFHDPYDIKLYEAAVNIFNKKYEYYKAMKFLNKTENI